MVAAPIAAESAAATDVVAVPVVVASLSLVLLAIALSWWLGLRIERSVAWASLRAAVQLIAVGFLLAWILRSGVPGFWAWIWVGVMGVVAAGVMSHRIPDGPSVILAAMIAITGSTAVSLGVAFGMGVFPLEPVSVVVVAGITLGNVLPTAVLAATQVVSIARDRPETIESLLALGFDRSGVVRQIGPRAARLALMPQVERTKVVGLIALPGALTGLLLAGVDPIDAVVIQLLVMYLVLGSAAMAAVVVVWFMARATVTNEFRLAGWVRQEPSRRGS